MLMGVVLVISCSRAQENNQMQSADYSVEVMAENLEVPWELVYGPDDHIWFTERPGTISRLNPETGIVTELISIDAVTARSETGLLGLALDPDFETSPFVYTVYTYIKSGDLTERVVRFTYNGNQLVNEEILLDDIPAANNHSGSRLLFMQDKSLLVTTGDALNTSDAQDINSLAGKTLRMLRNGSIPADNPSSSSYVYSLGHRNAQGLTMLNDGRIYSSEHGPSSDDEINSIEPNRNYGWPNVMGFCDASEQQDCDALNVKEPIQAYTPTLAVAGLAYYPYTAISEWEHSLLLVSLKEADLRVLKLSSDGMSIVSETVFFDREYGRLRAICTAPNGDVYFSTSNRDGRAPGGFPVAKDDQILRIRSNGSTGILQNKLNEFKLKNPVAETIDLRSIGRVDADVYNVQGEKIQSATNAINLTVDHLVTGWYVLKLYSNTSFATHRFYKE